MNDDPLFEALRALPDVHRVAGRFEPGVRFRHWMADRAELGCGCHAPS